MRDLLKNYTILYVEDEPSIRKNILEYLEGYFLKVYTATDGREALERYDKCNPDAILLDIDLPYIDGLSVANSIRQVDGKVSIIMLTAFADQEKLLKATELKLHKYLIKPIDLLEFQETLDSLAIELEKVSRNVVILREDYIWNLDCELLFRGAEQILLTVKEQQLMTMFMSKKNQSVSFEDIMAQVWEDEFDREISINSVKNIVSSLRKKLPANSIKSMYGSGYVFQQ